MQQTQRKRMDIRRVGKFGLVGVLNTAIDFAIFNTMHFGLHWSLIPSNLVSTSVAMIFSFYANRYHVFQVSGNQVLRQAVLFWLVTAVGVYGLQNGVIWLLTHPLLATSQAVVRAIGGNQGVLLANGAKAAAVGVSLIWNYLWYREVVFA